jgi:ParB family chromosome partitioning protein
MVATVKGRSRARYTARRKVIYLEKHPETKRGVAGAEAKHRANEKISFAAETAKKTGTSERIVQLYAERGEKIAADVLRKIKGKFIDNGVYLDELKKLSHDEQCVATCLSSRSSAVTRRFVALS